MLQVSHNLHMLKVTICQFNLLAHIIMVICHVRTLFCVQSELQALRLQHMLTNKEYFPFPLLVLL